MISTQDERPGRQNLPDVPAVRAAREIDFQVGNAVMGYDCYREDDSWVLADADLKPVVDVPRRERRGSYVEAWREDCPRFIEEIAAAWLVVGRLKSLGYIVRVQEVPERLVVGFRPEAAGHAVVILYGGNLAHQVQVRATSASFAICAAALELDRRGLLPGKETQS